MRTIKKVTVELCELQPGEFMPDNYHPGVIYYSPEYGGSGHLCLCGCGQKCWLTIGNKNDDWQLTKDEDGKVTIVPSILQRFDCKSHYIITKGVANFV